MQKDGAHSDILIIHKTYSFYLGLYDTAATIPKKDRFGLGLKCESLALEILELLYEANAKWGSARLALLQSVDIKLKVLQTLLKALLDVKAIDDKRYLQLSEQLIEIGKMLGGWIKTTKG